MRRSLLLAVLLGSWMESGLVAEEAGEMESIPEVRARVRSMVLEGSFSSLHSNELKALPQVDPSDVPETVPNHAVIRKLKGCSVWVPEGIPMERVWTAISETIDILRQNQLLEGLEKRSVAVLVVPGADRSGVIFTPPEKKFAGNFMFTFDPGLKKIEDIKFER